MGVAHEQIFGILLAGSAVVASILATRLSGKAGVPSLVLFLGLGFLLGSDVSGLVPFANAQLTQTVGVIALTVILFDGGLHTPMPRFRSILGSSLSLATIGVAVTAAIVGLVAYLVLPLTAAQAGMLAAIVSSTDAAAVFSVLRRHRIHSNVLSALEAESGINDPMAVFLTVLLLGWVTGDATSITHGILSFIQQMSVGAAGGLALGWMMRIALKHLALESSGLYAILLAAAALVAFAAIDLAGGSGFLGVYVMGLTVGSGELPYRRTALGFHAGFAWLMQIVLFVILGLFALPSEVIKVILPGLAISATLIFVARPLAVFVSTFGSRLSTREKTLMSWVGLRGAVPIVLATFPLIAHAPQSMRIFNVVLFVVVSSALVQGTTVSLVARWLKLTLPPLRTHAVSVELASMHKTNAEMLQVTLRPHAHVVDTEIRSLQLPRGLAITAIVRDERLIVPRGSTRLAAHDTLFLLSELSSEDEALAHFLG